MSPPPGRLESSDHYSSPCVHNRLGTERILSTGGSVIPKLPYLDRYVARPIPPSTPHSETAVYASSDTENTKQNEHKQPTKL